MTALLASTKQYSARLPSGQSLVKVCAAVTGPKVGLPLCSWASKAPAGEVAAQDAGPGDTVPGRVT